MFLHASVCTFGLVLYMTRYTLYELHDPLDPLDPQTLYGLQAPYLTVPAPASITGANVKTGLVLYCRY